MSTFSDAWHTADPDIRNFYRNFADVNTSQSWHWYWNTEYKWWQPCDCLGQASVGMLGYHIFQHNLTNQLWASGTFNKNTVMMVTPAWSWREGMEPAYRIEQYTGYQQQFITIPEYGYPYPRLRYRVRQSYWTGAPRHRRNL